MENIPDTKLTITKDNLFQILSDHLILDLSTDGDYEGNKYLTIDVKWQNDESHEYKTITSSCIRLDII
jgi:hypothetical protein